MRAIEVTGLRKEYGTLVAVNNVSFEIDHGHIIGLIGPNGAGKTTLLRMLATVLRPTGGTIRIIGFDTATEYLKIREHLGYLPDFFNLYNDLTLRECLEFFARAYHIEKSRIPKLIDETLHFIDLEDKRNDFVRHLSRGMVQRLGVGALMVHEPNLFLLDEPASGLDPKARIQLRDILKQLSRRGKTIIISSHILTELSDFCTHIAIMNKGSIISYGAIDDIRREIYDSRRIKVSVVENADRALTEIKGFAGINILSADANSITFEMKADDAGLANLNSHLVSKGIRVCGFSEQKTDLEDLFMKISGKEQTHTPEGDAQ